MSAARPAGHGPGRPCFKIRHAAPPFAGRRCGSAESIGSANAEGARFPPFPLDAEIPQSAGTCGFPDLGECGFRPGDVSQWQHLLDSRPCKSAWGQASKLDIGPAPAGARCPWTPELLLSPTQLEAQLTVVRVSPLAASVRFRRVSRSCSAGRWFRRGDFSDSLRDSSLSPGQGQRLGRADDQARGQRRLRSSQFVDLVACQARREHPCRLLRHLCGNRDELARGDPDSLHAGTFIGTTFAARCA